MNRLRAIVRVRRTATARLAAVLLIALTVLPFTAPFAVFDPGEYTDGKPVLWDDPAGKSVQDAAIVEGFGSLDAPWNVIDTIVLAAGGCAVVPARQSLVLRI